MLDEDVATSKHCQSVLKAQGWQVCTVADVTGAQRLFRRRRVDAVVVNIDAPLHRDLTYLHAFKKQNSALKIILKSDAPLAHHDFNAWIANAFLGTTCDAKMIKSSLQRLFEA